MRLLRRVHLVKLGFWAGLVASGILLQRVFPSRGDEKSNEVELVAPLNGVELKSRAQAFRGGTLLAWLGGIAVGAKPLDD